MNIKTMIQARVWTGEEFSKTSTTMIMTMVMAKMMFIVWAVICVNV